MSACRRSVQAADSDASVRSRARWFAVAGELIGVRPSMVSPQKNALAIGPAWGCGRVGPTPGGGFGWRRERLSSSRRTTPGGTPRPLLPGAGLAPRRRRRSAGNPATGMARLAAVRRSEAVPPVALQDRHQRVPQRPRATAPPTAPDRGWLPSSSRRRPRHTGHRVGLDRAVPGRAARTRRQLCRPGGPL
jgi:hypothetical protein